MSDKSPENQEHKKRSKYPAPFSMRFTEDERKCLKLAAAGRPLAAYIRWLIFKEDMPELPKKRTREKTPPQDHKQLAKLLGVLGQSRIANNINQLAKAANSGSLPVNEEIIKALQDAVKSVQWMRNTLIKGMGLKSQSASEENSDDP